MSTTPPPPTKPAIVLVHGGWHVPAHYRTFQQGLQSAGFEVHCPLLPTCSAEQRPTADMYADARAVRDQITALVAAPRAREVVLLCHSYGGAVGTEAARGLLKDENGAGGGGDGGGGGVIHIIYMCGFMLQAGECVASASLPRPVPDPVARDEAAGETWICEPPVPLFYADVVPKEKAEEMAALLVRQSAAAMAGEVTYPAWRHAPTTYLLTMRDEVLFPHWQERQIKAVEETGTRVRVERFDAGHSPFLSMPHQMVAAVERAVGYQAAATS
ncbi:MAG: hypothetical protein Q9173_002789 [Seirophora scorigena]